jgi:hypothetical protein
MAHSWGMRWAPYVNAQGRAYPLHHLHPFHRPVELPAQNGKPARELMLYVSFGLHTFTREIVISDRDSDLYTDDRESRAFDIDRYQRSAKLPGIFLTLERRKLEFARSKHGVLNYVTLELEGGVKYAAFFNLRRFHKMGPDAIHLAVLSAYPLTPGKPHPGKGRINLNTLIGHTLRGTKPHP